MRSDTSPAAELIRQWGVYAETENNLFNRHEDVIYPNNIYLRIEDTRIKKESNTHALSHYYLWDL